MSETAETHSPFSAPVQARKESRVKAENVAARVPYVDLHADTLTCAPARKNFLHRTKSSASLEKLVKGGCFLQCFALFSRSDDEESRRRAEEYLDGFLSYREEAERSGVKAVLTVENGAFTRGEEKWLARLLQAGVRLFGLTWNDENGFGYPCGSVGGLKPLGRRAAEKILAAGMIPDISHLSDAGAEEIFGLARTVGSPVVASHSLCREICPHKRNLTDAQIGKIASSGGVVGVNFVREFIGEAGIFEHIRHLIRKGGEDVAAIGTDFDGTENPLYTGADEMPRFFDDMKKAGFTPREIEKTACKNAVRLF